MIQRRACLARRRSPRRPRPKPREAASLSNSCSALQELLFHPIQWLERTGPCSIELPLKPNRSVSVPAALAAQDISIEVGEGLSVSGLWKQPAAARACLVLAHGAGAGMQHPFMAAVAEALGDRGVATLRYQ